MGTTEITGRIETEVLVVGSGLTGASAALLLARHGLRTVMVSRSGWVADSPRAHIVNQRTMEVMRSIGLADACRAQATPGELMANLVMVSPAITGREFGRVWSWGNDPERLGEYVTASPERTCDLPQDRLEPILLGEAARLGVSVRLGTRFIDLEQDDDGVTSVLEDLLTGARLQVRSRYVVGADGGQSAVARTIGLTMLGESNIAPALNIHFSADLSRYVAHRPGDLYWILQPDRPGALGSAMLRMVRPWHEWIGAFTHLSALPDDLDESLVTEAIRDLIRDDSIPISIRGIYPWRINRVVAENYGAGRVFCAGDAVHRHPPSNALGGNTCVQDAFNLSWKLAAVLRWGAGPELLDSYSAERQPVGRVVVDRAVQTWRENMEIVRDLGVDQQAAPDERQAQFEGLFAATEEGQQRRATWASTLKRRKLAYDAHGTEMNQIYSSAAVIADGEPPFVYDRDPAIHYQATTHPGARLPHCWVEFEGRTCSTLDLAAPERFTLLARPRGLKWIAAADELAGELPLELAALRIGPGCEVTDLYGSWEALSEVDETGCLLVRPDQHVAWRCRSAPDQPVAALRSALSRCLAMYC